MSVPYEIDALCQGVSYASRKKHAVLDVSGTTIGQCSMMPTVYIQDKIAQLRTAPSLSFAERYLRLKKASRIFENDTLGNLDPERYIKCVSHVTGLPQKMIAQSLKNISQGLFDMREIIRAATPLGAILDSSSPEVNEGCSLFSRRGDVVSIIAAGNGPGVHGLWPQAIAMGYRTFVRPSFREPFTAQRLVFALVLAGLSNYVALIPTDYKGAETLVSESDFAIVYGGADVSARYGKNPRVLVQGPGRSKIVVGRDVSHEDAVVLAAQSVLSLGGAACVSTSAILVEENHHAFAEKLRQELKKHSQEEGLTFGRQEDASAYEKLLKSDEVPWVYDSTTSNGCRLTPHVATVESATDPRVQRELPFPCVTVSPFDAKEASLNALSGSLVVTVLSRQKTLIDAILSDVSIANVYVGNIPTTWMDFSVPHDGYLADFLMCNRGVRVEAGWL